MGYEIGDIIEGKIVSITNFGAFVELEDKQIGLVHISEISSKYVENITDVYKVGDVVKVKLLSHEGEKVALSIKAVPSNKEDDLEQSGVPQKSKKPTPIIFRGINKKEEPKTFEEMLNRFKQNSEEKMSDIKKNIENKRGSYSRRK